MTEPITTPATGGRPTQETRGSGAQEATAQVTAAIRAMKEAGVDPVLRSLSRQSAEATLEQGTATLRQLGDGPGAAELASALRGLEQALTRLTADEAVATLPTRSTPRQTRLARSAQRSVNIGASAMSRSEFPGSDADAEAFAAAVVGDMSDRQLRALGRLSEDDLRTTLAEHGIDGFRADRAIGRVKRKIAGEFQRVVRRRGQRVMERTVRRFREAARPGSAEYDRIAGELLSGRGDELLRNLDTLGVDTTGLREALGGAQRDDGRRVMTSLTNYLPRAMSQAAAHVIEQTIEMSDWDRDDLYRDALPSRTFPGTAQGVKARWAMGGIVGEAVNEHVSEARENEAHRAHLYNNFIIAVGAVAGVLSGGVAGAVIAAGASAAARETPRVYGAWAESDRVTGRALAGMATAEEAERARRSAQITTGVAVGAGAVDMALAGALQGPHHTAAHGLEGASKRATDGFFAAVDGGAAYAIEQGAHAVDHALQEGDGH